MLSKAILSEKFLENFAPFSGGKKKSKKFKYKFKFHNLLILNVKNEFLLISIEVL